MLWHLERGQARSAVIAHGALAERDFGGGDDYRADSLPPLLVRASHDRRLDYAGAAFEHSLDLAGCDVLAATDDRVRLAPGDVQEAALVDAPEVAGVQATVCAQRATRDRGTGEQDLPVRGDLGARAEQRYARAQVGSWLPGSRVTQRGAL